MGRDKFAALASRAAESNNSSAGDASENQAASTSIGAPTATTTTPTNTAPTNSAPAPASAPTQPPRRDKLAALAARNTTSSAPPVGRGDKFAAMAASTDSTTVASNAGRGDKLASMTANTSDPPGGRGNKLAALSASGAGDSDAPAGSSQPQLQERSKEEEHLSKIEERLSQRKQILENLNSAEELTCKLLEIAHQTTTALQDLSSSPDISALSKAYRATLQELHPLLSTDTQDLIQPYQNHTNETKQSMYGARVEMRLAKERTEVLKAFTDLERGQGMEEVESTIGEKRKRPREEETINAS